MLYLGGADLRRAGEIDHFTAFLAQEVEFALPVVADDKGVDVVFVHVAALLVLVLLRNDQIDIADGFQQRLALLVGEVALLVLLVPVEFIGGKAHDQIIPQRLGSFEQVDVSVVQQIKCAVCDNSFHRLFVSLVIDKNVCDMIH